MNAKAIMAVLYPALELFPQSKITERGLILYVKALADLTPAEVEAAIIRHLRTSKFFPSVAEILEHADAIKAHIRHDGTPTAEEAWGEVQNLAKTAHIYKPWKCSCPEVERAVNYFGKEELCKLPADGVNTARAHFMRIYNSVAAREKDAKESEAAISSLAPAKQEALLQVIGGGVVKALPQTGGAA